MSLKRTTQAMIAGVKNCRSLYKSPAHRKAVATAIKTNRKNGHGQAVRRRMIADGADTVRGKK